MQTKPIDPKTLKHHADLFDRMGQAVGLDLQEEAIAGNLRFDEIPDALIRCTQCGGAKACGKWLKDLEGQGTVKTAPDYCRNLDLFDFLKDERGN